MSESWYDTAQVCINGHVINMEFKGSPEKNQKFCQRCGASTLIKCAQCSAHIKGYYNSEWIPYPWTTAGLKAARDMSEAVKGLSPSERETLKASLEDIVWDTPETTASALKFKRIVAKAGKVATAAFRDILVDIASEAAKKIIWPS